MMTLLQRSLAGSVLILVILLLRPLLRRHAPGWTLSALWMVAAARLILPVAVSLPVLSRTPGTLPPPVQSSALSFETGMANAVATTPVAEASSVDWLHLVWLIGALVLVAFFLGIAVRTMQKYRSAQPWGSPNDLIKLRRPVRVAISDAPGTPLTYGLLRPAILLPSALAYGNENHLHYVLAHEMTHIRRLDTLRKTLAVVAVCLHWFNPLAWAMLFFINRDIELACDEAVLRTFGPKVRAGYAGALLDCVVSQQKTLLTAHFGQKAVETRIRWILSYRKKSVLATALVLCLLLLSGISVSAMPVQVPLDPYAATIDWYDGWYAALQQYGVTCGADGYPEYGGNPLYAITFARNNGRWFQMRWDDTNAKADYPDGKIPDNAVFLQAVYEEDTIIDYVPISADTFYQEMEASTKAAQEKRVQSYAALGLTFDNDAMYYNGKSVHGLYDPQYWSRWMPDVPDDALYLMAKCDDTQGQNLIGFEELTQEAFEAIPMVATGLSQTESKTAAK